MALEEQDIQTLMNKGLKESLAAVDPSGKLATTWSEIKKWNIIPSVNLPQCSKYWGILISKLLNGRADVSTEVDNVQIDLVLLSVPSFQNARDFLPS